MTPNNLIKKSTLVVAGLAVSAIGAHAQTHLIQTNGTIVAYTGDLAPSGGGATFNASNLDSSSMDDAGRVFFRAQLVGAGVLPNNQRAYYTGTNRSDLTQVIRSADPVPTLAGGEILALSATSIGISSNTRYTGNGGMFWPGNIFGGASTTANDTALFTGTPGSFVIAAREGDPAPGTVGATMSSSLSGLGAQGTCLNNAGRITFQSATLGGDTTTANNAAWFTGTPGNLEMVIRKGAAIPSGEVISALGFNAVLNSSGAVFHDETLSTVLGTPPATAANNAVMMVYTPGVLPGTGTNSVLVREGDPAPGTVGAIMGVTSVFSSPFGFGTACFNNNGKLLINAALFPGVGDAVLNVNDNMMYLASATNPPVAVVRKGDPAPGLGGGELFGVINLSNTVLNNNDRFAFNAQLTGGSVTTANDNSTWFGSVGNLQMVVREGDAAPGTTGALIGNLLGNGNFWLNDANQLVFMASLTGGDVTLGVNEQMLYSWTAATGLTPIIRKGDSIEVNPTIFQTVNSFGGLQFSNGEGRGLSFNNSGKIGIDVNFTGAKAIMTVTAPNLVGTTECIGDTAAACPCSGSLGSLIPNPGAAGNGCGNSSFPGGAHLSGTGVAVDNVNDTLVLTCSGMPGPGLFFQSNALGGPIVNFNDGILCAAVGIIRMGVVFPDGFGVASYPGGLTPAPIHIAGAPVLTGGSPSAPTKHYQCWYRDITVGFCNDAGHNMSNGLAVVWAP